MTEFTFHDSAKAPAKPKFTFHEPTGVAPTPIDAAALSKAIGSSAGILRSHPGAVVEADGTIQLNPKR
jgi:hypothetical protein